MMNTMNYRVHTVILTIAALLTVSYGWQSELFPKSGDHYKRVTVERDSIQFTLPDFAYAGYQSGLEPIPEISATIELSPVQGDNAPQINKAVQKLARRKPDSNGFRGKLLLSAGTFELHDEIKIYHSGIVIGGAGVDATRLYVNSTDFARKSVFSVNGPESDTWSLYPEGAQRYYLTEDVADQARHVVLKPGHPFLPGDTLILRQWPHEDFARTHGANGINIWPVTNDNTALKFCRVVRRVDGATLFFDEPVRHALHTEYGAHVFSAAFIHNIGVENLSIGFRRGPDTENNGKTHRAAAISMTDVANGWVRNVNSYQKDDKSVHLQSYGFAFRACKWLTIENCSLQDPQNKNVGGNGYLYDPICSDDLLFRNCAARNGRHNFTIHYSTSGCVFTGCISESSRSDFHQFLSTENLFENFTIVGDSVTAGNRGDKSQGSWFCATKPVFWNMRGAGAMYLNAYGSGYLIGADEAIRIGVGDKHILQDYGLSYLPHRQWIEQGDGELKPQSLYRAQLQARKRVLNSRDTVQ